MGMTPASNLCLTTVFASREETSTSTVTALPVKMARSSSVTTLGRESEITKSLTLAWIFLATSTELSCFFSFCLNFTLLMNKRMISLLSPPFFTTPTKTLPTDTLKSSTNSLDCVDVTSTVSFVGGIVKMHSSIIADKFTKLAMSKRPWIFGMESFVFVLFTLELSSAARVKSTFTRSVSSHSRRPLRRDAFTDDVIFADTVFMPGRNISCSSTCCSSKSFTESTNDLLPRS
mmetsp:Transcript_27352/g.107004  ORF Transcript_27352/g.107004 Transcript_27352/m.107004 type:complete len:232 (-) Transcript_27352:2944-3639(-)